MSEMLPTFDYAAITTMTGFALQLVQTHATLITWLAGILMVIFVFTYLVNQVNRPPS